MRKLFVIVALFCAASLGWAANDVQFIDEGEMPDLLQVLPGPPLKGSPEYSKDSIAYLQAKVLRSTPRGETAIKHEKMKVKHVMPLFGNIMGLPLKEKDYPILADLIRGTMRTVKGALKTVKKKYARHRPYQDFGEPTSIPEDEDPKDYTSYPSSHAARAWALALLFAELDPEHKNDYVKLGFEMGQSRVIVGFHYQSDVDAARKAAEAIYSQLQASEKFQDYQKKAREEIARGKEELK